MLVYVFRSVKNERKQANDGQYYCQDEEPWGAYYPRNRLDVWGVRFTLRSWLCPAYALGPHERRHYEGERDEVNETHCITGSHDGIIA